MFGLYMIFFGLFTEITKRVMAWIFIFVMIVTGFGNSDTISTDINNYDNDCAAVKNAADFMPSLDELGAYENIRYTYKIKCYSAFMGFYSDGLALFVKYDDENYELQKELALSSYQFLEEPIKEYGDYTLPATEFEYRDYWIRVIPDEDYIDYCACKSFAMLGVNDDLNTLVYMYFYDFDIDYIATEDQDPVEEMHRLIDDAFAWVDDI